MTDWPDIQRGLGKLTPDRWRRLGLSVEQTELGGATDERSETRETSHPAEHHRTHFSAALVAYAQVIYEWDGDVCMDPGTDCEVRPNLWAYAFREVQWKGVEAGVDQGNGTVKSVVLPRPFYIPGGNSSYVRVGLPTEDGIWNRFGRPAWNRAEVRNLDFKTDPDGSLASGGINMKGSSYPSEFFLQPVRAGNWNIDPDTQEQTADPGAFGNWPIQLCPIVEMTTELINPEGYQVYLFDWPNVHDGICETTP